MPIYEYKCSDCGFCFDEIQSIDEDPLSICPKCNGELKQLISRTFANVEYSNPKEYVEKVLKPDAKKIAEKIKNGDENAAADIFGEPK